VVIIAATSKAEEHVVCGFRGFVLDEVGEYPRCKPIDEQIARRISARQERREAMPREVEQILRDEDE
jgi:hypothetical protein